MKDLFSITLTSSHRLRPQTSKIVDRLRAGELYSLVTSLPVRQHT